MNDLLIWVGFLIVYSIMQSLSKKKKQKGKEQVPASPDAQKRPATLQDALREIQEAFEQAQRPPATTEPVQETIAKPERRSEPVVSKPKYEPEFHSLEKPVYARNLEKETRFKETYSKKSLEKNTTYDQQFKAASTFSDDNFRHAHPDRVISVKKPKKRPTKKALPDLLKDRTTLSQLFLFQEILGKPVSRKRPDERRNW